MLERLMQFVADLTASRSEPTFTLDDPRLAVAALMMHVIAVDGAVTADESERLQLSLSEAYGLSTADTEELIAAAKKADLEAVDLYSFTSVLKRRVDEPGRLLIVEMLWDLVFADGVVHEFEDNVVWRIADLLGVSTRERVLIRKRMSPASGSDPDS